MEIPLNYFKYKDKKIAYQRVEYNPSWPYIIFLHDSLGCIQFFKDFPAQVAQTYNFNYIVYDRLGYGQSDDFISLDRTIDYMHQEADILIELMQDCGIEKAHLYGHSDGASIALLCAARHPEQIISIACEGAHIFIESHTIKGIEAAAQEYLQNNLKEKLIKYHGDKMENVFLIWIKTWQKETFQSWNIEKDIQKIQCPTLAFQGVDDEFGTPFQMQRIAANIPHDMVYTHLIPGARHTPRRENPEYTRLILDHFYKAI